MTVVLRARDMSTALDYRGAVDAVSEAFLARTAANGATVSASERSTVRFDDGWLRILSGTLPEQDLLGFKAFHQTGGTTVRYLCALYRLSTGEPLALLDAQELTVVRTAAAAAAAARHHWADAAIRVGVVGSGIQAREGLRALASVCTVAACKVYSRSAENRTAFATDMSRVLDLEVVAVDRVRDAAADVDLLLCATHSTGDLAVEADELGDAAYVSSVGSTLPTQRELHHEIVGRAACVVVDTLDALDESGDLVEADRAGLLDRSRVVTMSAYLATERNSRSGGPTIYKSIGSVEQDLAVAGAAVRAATARGIGETLSDIESVKVV